MGWTGNGWVFGIGCSGAWTLPAVEAGAPCNNPQLRLEALEGREAGAVRAAQLKKRASNAAQSHTCIQKTRGSEWTSGNRSEKCEE